MGSTIQDRRRESRAGRAGLWSALAGALLLAACTTPAKVAPPPVAEQAAAPQAEVPVARPSDGRIRVALLLPLSGRNAAVGQAMLDAAQMALFDQADDRFLLMPRDTDETPAGAAEAARAAAADGAMLILGPLFGTSAKAAGPAAAEAGLSVLSFSNDSSAAGGNVWVLGFQVGEQVRRVMGYAKSQGPGRVAVLAPTNASGEAAVAAAGRAAGGLGAELVRVQRYSNPGDLIAPIKRLGDFDARKAALAAERARLTPLAQGGDGEAAAALRRLGNAETFGEVPFDALLLAEGGARLRELAPLLPYYDIDPGPVRFLGTGQWDEPGLGREPSLIGGWYAAPDPEARAGFEGRFRALYGRTPPRLATLAYDAVALAAVLGKKGGAQPFTRTALVTPSGFAGVDGLFRLLPSGIAERALAVLEVTRGAPRVIDPAPTTFQTPAS